MNLLPELIAFLRDNRRLYTVRKELYSTTYADVPDFGRISRRYIAEVRKVDDLAPYVQYSGFSDVRTWWRRIKQFNRRPAPYYVWDVRPQGEEPHAN